MSGTDPRLQVLLACFEGHKRAGKNRRRLSDQVKADWATILDDGLVEVNPKGKARPYDPRRTRAGTLASGLTWGVFGALFAYKEVSGLGSRVCGGGCLARFKATSPRSDVIAGLTVWAVLVPEALAYATIAGVSPVIGLYAAPAALILYAAFGSSKLLITGQAGRSRRERGGVMQDPASELLRFLFHALR